MNFFALLLLAISILFMIPTNLTAQSPDIPANRDAILNSRGASYHSQPTRRKRLSKEAKAFLAPPADLIEAYKDFLRQPNTGIAKLLPLKEKLDQMTVAADNPEVFIALRDGGAYYSFSDRKHVDDAGAEIFLGNDLNTGTPGKVFWAVWGRANIGMMARLGDMGLDEVTSSRIEARFLFEFSAPTQYSVAKEQQKQASIGFQREGVAYKNCAPAEENTTYLFRIINYGTSDLLVAFRTIRKEPDSSYVILWKILKKNPVPRLQVKYVLSNGIEQ